MSLHPDKARFKVRIEQFIIAELWRRLCVEFAAAQTIVWDCPVPGGCTLKSPDFLLKFLAFYLQLEIDEHGHDDRSCADEDTRLAIIAADVDLPGVIVRLNPDVKGFACFRTKQLSNGQKVFDAVEEHFTCLMDKAEQEIRKHLTNPPTELLRVFIDADPASGIQVSRVWADEANAEARSIAKRNRLRLMIQKTKRFFTFRT